MRIGVVSWIPVSGEFSVQITGGDIATAIKIKILVVAMMLKMGHSPLETSDIQREGDTLFFDIRSPGNPPENPMKIEDLIYCIDQATKSIGKKE